MIKLTLNGTNGWYTSQTGYTLSILIQTDDYTIILDAGEGIHKIADLCPEITTPTFLFLSHIHIDHISGFHTLARLSCKQGLTICVPRGLRQRITDFINYPFTIPLNDLSYPVRIIELPDEISVLPFKVTTGWLKHTQPVVGYRFSLSKEIAFCTDTGRCDMLYTLAKDADLLITECSNLPGEISDDWPHLCPEQTFEVAKTADAKQLLLVHFSADRYTTKDMRENIRNLPLAPQNLIIGQDDMVIEL